MSLYTIPRGGPSPMESIGGGASKLAQAFLQKKLLERKTQREEQQTGQESLSNYIALSNIYGPDILKSPGFQAVAQKAGMGGLEIPEGIEGALGAEIPKGHEVTRTYGAFGRPKGTTVKAPSGADKLSRWRLEQLGKMTPEEQKQYMLKPPATATATINMEKTTRGKIEDELLELNRGIFGLEQMKEMYDPSYSTWATKAKQWETGIREKAKGLPVIGDILKPPTEEDKATLAAYQGWFGQAKAEFLAFRRWATGVAGGEKEMREIATAFPDPVSSSPTEFISMLDQAIAFRRAYREELTKQLVAGTVIDAASKSKIAMKALGKIRPSTKAESKEKDISEMTEEELKKIAGIE